MKIREFVVEAFQEQEGDSVGSIKLTYFIMSMACIMTLATTDLLAKNMPTVVIGGKESGGKGQPFSDVKGIDVVQVMSGADIWRHMILYQQTLRFLNWYLNQDILDDVVADDGNFFDWDDLEYVEKRWNEYLDEETRAK